MNYTWKEKLAIIKDSLVMIGPILSLRYILIYLLGYMPGSDRSFDRKYGTDTTGLISTSKLSISDVKSSSNAIVYLPAPEGVTRYMLQSLPVNHPEFTFVDYGSGKGRVMLTASTFPFKKIIGVEISSDLHAIAKKNIQAYKNPRQKCSNFELNLVNALDYTPPPVPTVFHFYHPFLPEVLAPVLNNIKQSLQAHPRPIYILYLYHLDYVAATFRQAGFVSLIKEVKCLNSQYNWALYTNSR
ncbi:class I SAM-dependent methyltransferase [Desulfonatronovibrio magnus]|uniref:class I SAM-dependent methyltransferase n=1 Tax=Desulfonatronovibrio magnus TaxID=698827 RepID=UPI0006962FA1|nr:class I SAM-dependent methyltransferase [Desulfonatronovibrio magnus]